MAIGGVCTRGRVAGRQTCIYTVHDDERQQMVAHLTGTLWLLLSSICTLLYAQLILVLPSEK